MTLNEKLIQFYKFLDELNLAINNQLAKREQDIANFNPTYIRELATRRDSALRVIGKLKSEADTNFFKFVYQLTENKPNANTREQIRQLYDIVTSTNNKERLVIIDDTICVNESRAEEAKDLLDSLNKVKVNNALIAELESHLKNANDIEQERIRKVIKLLKAKSKKLVNVWNIGYVSSRSASALKDLILNSEYLFPKVSQNPINKRALRETLDALNDLQIDALDNPNAILVDNFIVSPAASDEASALITKYKTLKEAIDSKKLVPASDGTNIAPKSLSAYEGALKEMKKRNLLKEAFTAIQSHFAEKSPMYSLKREAIKSILSKQLGISKDKPLLALPAPSKRTLKLEKMEQIMNDALQVSGENRSTALNEAVNTIKTMTNESNHDESNPELDSILAEVKAEKAISEKMNAIFKQNDAFSSEENMKKSIDQLISEVTDGTSAKLDSLLKDVKELLKDQEPEELLKDQEEINYRKDSQILIDSNASKTTASKPKISIVRIGKWSWNKLRNAGRNAKIFWNSLKAIGLTEGYRLGENPYVTKLVNIFNTIKERIKLSFDISNGYHESMPEINKPLTPKYPQEIAQLNADLQVNNDEYSKTLLIGIMKCGQLITEATNRIAETKEFIKKATDNSHTMEYDRINELRNDITISENEIKRAKEQPNEYSDIIIAENEKRIDKYKEEIEDIENLLTEYSETVYASEYAYIRDLQNYINSLREKMTLANLKRYKKAMKNNNPERAKMRRDSVMQTTGLDLYKYYDIENASKDIKKLFASEPDELVRQMKYVIDSLGVLLEDTRTRTERDRMCADIVQLNDTVTLMEETNNLSLFKK